MLECERMCDSVRVRIQGINWELIRSGQVTKSYEGGGMNEVAIRDEQNIMVQGS